MHGEGVFDTIADMPSRIVKAVKGIRTDFRPQDREFIKRYGYSLITSITIYRKPVQAFISPILNAVSLGKFGDLLNEKGIDTLFHLFMVISFKPVGEQQMNYKIEKNEVITITKVNGIEEGESINVSLKRPIPINQLLYKTKEMMGDNFFSYNGLTNNCQNFVMSILQANDLLKPEYKEFIYQDVSDLERELPDMTKSFMNGTTGLASRLDILKNGYGFRNLIMPK
jgi:hypothetical protein